MKTNLFVVSVDCTVTLVIVQRAISWFQRLRWWCEQSDTFITWSVLHVNNVVTGMWIRAAVFCSCLLEVLLFHFKLMINNIALKYVVKILTKSNFRVSIVKKCRFCVGDRFYLSNNKILCESDYADLQMHTEMSQQQSVSSSSSGTGNTNNPNNNNNISITNNNNNNNEYSMNRNTATKSQASGSSSAMMPLYSEKNNFTNFDVPIHVR